MFVTPEAISIQDPITTALKERETALEEVRTPLAERRRLRRETTTASCKPVVDLANALTRNFKGMP